MGLTELGIIKKELKDKTIIVNNIDKGYEEIEKLLTVNR